MTKVKKTLLYLSLILMLGLGSCQNNGNIGSLFGTWRIDYYSVDGVEVKEIDIPGEPLPLSHVMFSFQNNIVQVATVLDDYKNYSIVFGTWEENDGNMILDFTHADANTPAGTGVYSAPTWIGMISDQKMVMKKTDNKKDSFTLTWNDPRGYVRVYKLHKTW